MPSYKTSRDEFGRFAQLPRVHTAGDMLLDPVWSRKFHQNRNHELLHFVKGRVLLTRQDGSQYPAGPGDTLFNPAAVNHRDVFEPHEEVDVFMIVFDWEHANDFFTEVTNEKMKDLSVQTRSEIGHIFDIMRCDAGAGTIDLALANVRLLNILLLLYRDITGRPEAVSAAAEDSRKRHKHLLEKAKNYIDRNYRQPVRLEDVAEFLQISPFHLSRIFSRESDFSFVGYLTDKRINEAKKLLLDGRYIVADVARMVGYEDSNYFSKVFKSRTGCSPGRFPLN